MNAATIKRFVFSYGLVVLSAWLVGCPAEPTSGTSDGQNDSQLLSDTLQTDSVATDTVYPDSHAAADATDSTETDDLTLIDSLGDATDSQDVSWDLEGPELQDSGTPEDTGQNKPAQANVSIDATFIPSGGIWDFGPHILGAVSPLVFITIENQGDTPLSVEDDIVLQGPGTEHFFLLFGPKGPIAGGSSQAITMAYTPVSTGKHQVFLELGHNGAGANPYVINLTGEATPPPKPTPLFMGHAGCCTRLLSTDGKTWFKVTDVPDQDLIPITAMTFVEDRFVGVGGSANPGPSRFVLTNDGSFYLKDTVEDLNARFNLLHHDGVLVSGGADGQILFSTDKGTSWEYLTDMKGPEHQGHYRHGTIGQDQFVLTGSHCPVDAPPISSVAQSADGASWEQINYGNRCLGEIAYGNSIYVAMGDSDDNPDSNLLYWDCNVSTNLTNWIPCTDLMKSWPHVRGPQPLLFLNGEFVALGGVRSSNGTQWTSFDWASGKPDALIWANDQYVGFGWQDDDSPGCRAFHGKALDALIATPLNLTQAECPSGLAFGWAAPNFDPEEATLKPSLMVTSSGAVLASESAISFGAIQAHDFSLKSMFLTNNGKGALHLIGDPQVAITGPDPMHFAWVQRPASTLASGEFTELVLMYTPSKLGKHEATLTLRSNDPTAPEYNLTISGEALPASQPLPRFVASSGCCERWVSNDGISWSKMTDALPLEEQAGYTLRDLQVLGGHFVALGGGKGQARMAVSQDGETWLHDVLYPDSAWQGGVGIINGILVGAGEGGAARYSFDGGASWQPTHADTMVDRHHLATGFNTVLALGPPVKGGSVVSITHNGLHWTSKTIPGLHISKPAFGNGVFVAAGTSQPYGYAWSTDGLEWNLIEMFSSTTELENLGFHDGLFYFRTPESYYTSPDGVTWDHHPQWIPSHITHGYGLWVGYDNGAFYYGTDLDDLFQAPGPPSNADHLVFGTRPPPQDLTWYCDPLDPYPIPGLIESCDPEGLDENCDGQVNEEDAQGCTIYLRDEDADGFGVALDSQCLCAPSAPYTASAANPGDCNDQLPEIHPGQPELCDGIDNNCEAGIDETFPDLASPCVPEGAPICSASLVICHADLSQTVCDPQYTFAPLNTPCDDGNACTSEDSCSGGLDASCTGTNIDCDDEDVCTDDTCEPTSGCATTYNNGPCNDGAPDTIVDTCAEGFCLGTPEDCIEDVQCDDTNPCNGIESCDPVNGCLPGEAPLCDDDNPCNGLETCHTTLGCQPAEPLNCSDGDACNGLEACDPITGCQAGLALICDDNNACNGLETCHPLSGCVDGVLLACDDGNPCNGLETCQANTGCIAAEPLVCDDDNLCNGVEICAVDGGCQPGEALTCDDNEGCNGIEQCDPSKGCIPGTGPVNGPINCDDGDVCNGLETCGEGEDDGTPICLAGIDIVCDDNDACNGSESCDAAEGCQPGELLVCENDDDICNGVAVCNQATGACTTQNILECVDADTCNGIEQCDPTLGCVPGPPLQCNDGDLCNGTEWCESLTGCQEGIIQNCDDGSECTDDACDPLTGSCLFIYNIAPCDDGQPCTVDDHCTSGLCAGTYNCSDSICAWNDDADCKPLWIWTPEGLLPTDGKMSPEAQTSLLPGPVGIGTIPITANQHPNADYGIWHQAAGDDDGFTDDLLVLKSDGSQPTWLDLNTKSAVGPEGNIGCVTRMEVQIAVVPDTGLCAAQMGPGRPLVLSAVKTTGEIVEKASFTSLPANCRVKVELASLLGCIKLEGYRLGIPAYNAEKETTVSVVKIGITTK